LTFNKINAIVAAKDAVLDYIQQDAKFQQAEKLVEIIFTQPFTKVSHLVDPKQFAEKTARKYLNELCDLQVLEKKVIDGKHYYLNLELYKILSE
jgi:Fic family protein